MGLATDDCVIAVITENAGSLLRIAGFNTSHVLELRLLD